ncbi:MAG: CopG family transcriptional regulator, partial [Ruthenibacterium sp.]
MQKNVYSIVLMDDVVAAIDRLAYHAGTSRSNMINRILAEYSKMDTPEQRMQDIFAAVSTVIEQQNVLQPMLSASDVMLNLRSALQYKYNPSVRYVLE